MIIFAIILEDKDGAMGIKVTGDSISPSTGYEVDFAEELMKSIYENGHRIAKEHGDEHFGDLSPMTIEKRKPKK